VTDTAPGSGRALAGRVRVVAPCRSASMCVLRGGGRTHIDDSVAAAPVWVRSNRLRR
jgi:hypothetical protein